MRRNIIHIACALLAMGGLLMACDNTESMKDVIYFTGTDSSPVVKYSVEEPTSLGMSVRSSKKVEQEVVVSMKVNKALLEEYNAANGTAYSLLPEEVYAFEASEAVIKAGNFSSDPFYLKINSVDGMKDEDIYCLPIELVEVTKGYMPILEASRTMYVVINKTIITQATILNGTYFYVDFNSNPDIDVTALPQLSMEARIYVDDYQNSSPFISTIIGCEENFLLRLGDVTVPKDYMQLAGGGYQVSSTVGISQNKWIHVATTYDGSRINLYINGVLNAYKDAPRGTINLLNGSKDGSTQISFFIGTTSNSKARTLKGKISEARVWTRALTEVEIANNICAVSPEADGLLAYWRFNSYKDDTNKHIVVDYTGHGFDAIGNKNITFVEGVRCP